MKWKAGETEKAADHLCFVVESFVMIRVL